MYNIFVSRGRGGIGIRARLRGVWETVRVQVPSSAPKSHSGFDTIPGWDFFLYIGQTAKKHPAGQVQYGTEQTWLGAFCKLVNLHFYA